MKKLFIAALLTVTVVTSAFSADETKVDVNILKAFEYEFAGANDVQWSVKSDYIKATFQMDGVKTDAFYNHQGESIGLSRKITLENLPVQAKRTFAKKYANYIVKEAIEFQAGEETAYFVSAENEKHSVVLKITATGISTFKKTNK